MPHTTNQNKGTLGLQGLVTRVGGGLTTPGFIVRKDGSISISRGAPFSSAQNKLFKQSEAAEKILLDVSRGRGTSTEQEISQARRFTQQLQREALGVVESARDTSRFGDIASLRRVVGRFTPATEDISDLLGFTTERDPRKRAAQAIPPSGTRILQTDGPGRIKPTEQERLNALQRKSEREGKTTTTPPLGTRELQTDRIGGLKPTEVERIKRLRSAALTSENARVELERLGIPFQEPAVSGETPEESVESINAAMLSQFAAGEAPPVREEFAKLFEGITGIEGVDFLTAQTPEQFSAADKFNELRTDFSVETLETQLSDIKAQEEEIQATLRQRTQAELDRPVSLSVISGRITETERQELERLDFLGRQKARVVDELQTKYQVIDQIMRFEQTDYTNALNRYNTQFSQNIQLLNLMRGIETQEKNDEEKAIDNARANVQTTYNIMKENGLTFSDMPEADQTTIRRDLTRANLPTNLFEQLQFSEPAFEFKGSTTFVDEDGEEFVSALLFNPETGEFKTQKISLGMTGDVDFPGTDIIRRGARGGTQAGVTPGFTEEVGQSFVTEANELRLNQRISFGGESGIVTQIDRESPWIWGLDVDHGADGSEVTSPVKGTFIGFGKDSDGFGNFALIQKENGNIVRLSHFGQKGSATDQNNTSMFNESLNIGDIVDLTTFIGTQGNSGTTFAREGGTGGHVDYTTYVVNQDFSGKSIDEINNILQASEKLTARETAATFFFEGSDLTARTREFQIEGVTEEEPVETQNAAELQRALNRIDVLTKGNSTLNRRLAGQFQDDLDSGLSVADALTNVESVVKGGTSSQLAITGTRVK